MKIRNTKQEVFLLLILLGSSFVFSFVRLFVVSLVGQFVDGGGIAFRVGFDNKGIQTTKSRQ